MQSDPFDQPTYLLIIGMIKYTPVFLFAILGGHIVKEYAKKGFIVGLIAVQMVIIFFLKTYTQDSYASLILLGSFVIFSLIYEPLIDYLTAYYSEKKGEYIYMNSIVSLSRTSARLLAPMMFVYVIAKNNGDIFSTTQIMYLILAVSIMFIDFPKLESGEKKQKKSLIVCMKNIISNKTALGILLIYCVFYLGINYLEYIVVISQKFASVQLGDLFMTMGAGFVCANASLLILKDKIKSIHMMTFSLGLSGTMLIMLPWIEVKYLVFMALFLIGCGNGLAVPISMGYAQKLLKKDLIPYFSGLLDTAINVCAIVSVGIGFVLMKTLGAKGVFLFDGLFLLMSMLIWVSLNKNTLGEIK
ncbi:MFS transporter [bacterium]|nr:MFS transporter [bacterium]